jgi:ribosome-associated toxin RatA of RatAB toxin-antitoxin module
MVGHMRQLERSALLAYSAEDLYRLVSDIEAYPQFLPGCTAATLQSREFVEGQEQVRARLSFKVKGLADSFASENLGDPGRRIEMRLLEGPFRSLSGIWEFQPLDEKACKVSLRLSLEFGNRLMDATLSPWISRAVSGVMDAFRLRAEQLYGSR